MHHAVRLAIAAVLAFATTAADAAGTKNLHPLDLEVVETAVFLRHHPDVRGRLDGLVALDEGREEAALEHFREASGYGDKVSQGMVAEMYWNGQGVPVQRALAYAWMDLAAERGYVSLIGKREQYWAALSEQERAQAKAIGESLYQEFGDAVSLPRLHTSISQGRRQASGGRVGAGGSVMAIYPGGTGNKVTISLIRDFGVTAMGGKRIQRMWSSRFWNTEKYLKWKAAHLDGEVSGLGELASNNP